MMYSLRKLYQAFIILVISSQSFGASAIAHTYYHSRTDESKIINSYRTLVQKGNPILNYQPDLEPNIDDYDNSSELVESANRSLILHTNNVEPIIADGRTNQSVYTIHNFNEDTLPKCPIGLTAFQTVDNKIMCYKILVPSQFPPSCPYPISIDYPRFGQLYSELTNKLVWAYAQKNKNTRNFEWMYNVKNSTIDLNLIENVEFESTYDCLVFNQTKLVPVKCNQRYYGLCIYNIDFILNDDNCKRRLNETCFNSNLGLNECYCINDHPSPQPRNSYCTKLATFEEPYKNYMVSQQLVKNQHCWFDLDRNKWVSNTDSLKYSYWSNSTDFSKTYGAIGSHGWILESDQNVSCAVCEVNIESFRNVKLVLKQSSKNQRIQLEIFNSLDAFEGVLCLTGNDSHYINLSKSKDDYILQDLWLMDDVKEYCWCQTLQLPNLQTVYSNKIVTSRRNHNIYVAVWSYAFDNITNTTTYSCPEITSAIIVHAKLFARVLLTNEHKVRITCHYYAIKTNSTSLEQYNTIKQLLTIPYMTMERLANAKVCLPSTTVSGNKTLHWGETHIGATVIPEEICLQENGEPLTRTCGGNFTFGAEWMPVNGSCSDTPVSSTTVFLNDMLHTEIPSKNLSTQLVRITSNADTINGFEIHLISKLLEKIASEAEDISSLDNVITTVSNIMQIDVDKLSSSQESLNSTDIILCSLDNILIELDDTVKNVGYINENSDKLLMQAASLVRTDITGYKLGSSEGKTFDDDKLRPLHQYTNTELLLEENLEIVLLVPRDLHDGIVQCDGSKSKPTLITSMFYDDTLFNEVGNATGKQDGTIVSVLIPGFNCTFPAPIQVIFKSSVNTSFEEQCASWTYGSNDLMESIHGHWKIEHEPIILGNLSQYRLCEYSHVTHFALLVLGEKPNISSADKKALDIITAVGSALSLLGLLGVFLTAILFKVYRATNGVVINFSAAMAAQIILLFIADNTSGDATACSVLGALLHYAVLAQFFWMLTIAILQYQRYVTIFSSPPVHLVAKACAFAWGLPLILVVIIVIISPDNYGENVNGLCYATGHYFTFGLLVPVALIILVNIMIFLRIMISIAASRRIKVHHDRGHTSVLQLRLAFMLFFLLGLTWGFGLLASIGGSVIYSYLFCITATLQGFILFLFFIVLNDKTRMLWMNMKICCSKSEEYDVNRDSSATSVMMRQTKTTSSDTCTDSATSEILRKVKTNRSSEY